MTKRGLTISLVVCAVLMGGLWGGDILSDRAYRLEVVGAAPLYSLPPYEYPKLNPVVATLKPGQPVRVLRLRYGKDFQAFRVETEDGFVGWVIGGEGVKVVSHG
jgi:hypothetical protein